MSRRSRAGVTFMEIVYALAIIAVVAAIIFPVFQPIRHRPRWSCQSNLKQLGLAYIQYEQDDDSNFPVGVNAAGNGWAGQVYPYVGRFASVYQCPDDASEGKFISYAENQNLVKQSVNNLAAPAATVELYEFTTLNCDPASRETVSATGLSAPQNSRRHDSDKFPFGLNFAFADGHVKYLTPGQVSGGPNAVRAKALPQGTYMETFAIK
jgi:prepilin-type processing-associated H-X9-DG protein